MDVIFYTNVNMVYDVYIIVLKYIYYKWTNKKYEDSIVSDFVSIEFRFYVLFYCAVVIEIKIIF